MMNVILDTNAFIYLYNLEKGFNVPTKWNKKKFDGSTYMKLIKSAKYIIITGETLHELVYQSIVNTGDTRQFDEQYQFILQLNKRQDKLNNLIILNWRNGMYFDMDKYKIYCEGEKKTDINEIVFPRLDTEKRFLRLFMNLLTVSINNVMFELIEDIVYTDLHSTIIKEVNKLVDTELDELYREYYITRTIKKGDFEKFLDKSIKIILYEMLSSTQLNFKLCDIHVEFYKAINNREKYGVTYIKKFFNIINSSRVLSEEKIDFKSVFLKELKFNLQRKELQNLSIVEKEFIESILVKYMFNHRRLSKNDIVDFFIITSIENTDLFTPNGVKINEPIKLVTFDTIMYEFSKEKAYLYDSDVYNRFLVN